MAKVDRGPFLTADCRLERFGQEPARRDSRTLDRYLESAGSSWRTRLCRSQ